MKPNNEFTSSDQRFFFPVNHEAECHESFDLSAVPQVEIIPGRVGYAIGESTDGEVVAGNSYYDTLYSGVTIKSVIGLDGGGPAFGRYPTSEMLQELIGHRVGEYQIQQGDQLILTNSWWRPEDPLFKMMDEGEALVIKAGEPLPYRNGTAKGNKDEETAFKLIGIINEQGRLVGMPGAVGEGDRYLVDLVVANAEVSNRLELALVADALSSGGHLGGLVSCYPAVKTYLKEYDKRQGSNYSDIVEPHGKFANYPEFSRSQRRRYFKIMEVAHSFINLRGGR